MAKDKKRSSRSSSSKSSSESKERRKKLKKHKHHKENKDKGIHKKKEKDIKKQSPKKEEEIKKNDIINKTQEDITADQKIEKILERIKESNPVEPENPMKNKPLDPTKKKKEPPKFEPMNSAAPKMIEVIVNDRLGKKVRIKCCPEDTIGDLKKLIAVQTGTKHDKIRLQKWYNIYKDQITLQDYEIHDGMGLEMYYN